MHLWALPRPKVMVSVWHPSPSSSPSLMRRLFSWGFRKSWTSVCQFTDFGKKKFSWTRLRLLGQITKSCSASCSVRWVRWIQRWVCGMHMRTRGTLRFARKWHVQWLDGICVLVSARLFHHVHPRLLPLLPVFMRLWFGVLRHFTPWHSRVGHHTWCHTKPVTGLSIFGSWGIHHQGQQDCLQALAWRGVILCTLVETFIIRIRPCVIIMWAVVKTFKSFARGFKSTREKATAGADGLHAFAVTGFLIHVPHASHPKLLCLQMLPFQNVYWMAMQHHAVSCQTTVLSLVSLLPAIASGVISGSCQPAVKKLGFVPKTRPAIPFCCQQTPVLPHFINHAWASSRLNCQDFSVNRNGIPDTTLQILNNHPIYYIAVFM